MKPPENNPWRARRAAAMEKSFDSASVISRSVVFEAWGSAAEPDSSIAATKAAEAKGEAKQTAKFWGLAAGLPVPIGGTI
jgi:hypothetical protein